MSAFPRYAIYYVPARDCSLYRLGAETLGYDAFTGDNIAIPPDVLAHLPDWHAITADARTYGFHATLKAPFALANDRCESELTAACAVFCTQPREIPRVELMIAAISGFIALVPAKPSPALAHLASDAVAAFDMFRAPLDREDRARRNPSKLTTQQIAYLDRWGYPYVMDEFRFHMTLTDRLAPEKSATAQALLSHRFTAAGPITVAIDRVAVLRQEAAGRRFRIVEHYVVTDRPTS